MERTLKKATRFTIQSPFNTNDINYKQYNERLVECRMLSLFQRRRITYVILLIRIIKNEITTGFNGIIERLMRQNRPSTRSRDVIMIDHNLITKNSPLYYGITCINKYKNLFDLNDSISLIKIKLRDHFLNEGDL